MNFLTTGANGQIDKLTATDPAYFSNLGLVVVAGYCAAVNPLSSRAAVYCLAVAETLVWAAMFYSFPALLLRWEADLGWSKTELTAAFTAAVVVSALSSPLAGRLIDLGRGPLVLTGCSVLGSIALIGLSQVHDYSAFVACWLVLGLAMGGCLYEPCFILITRTRGENAQRAITLVTLFAGFAGTLSFPLGHFVAEIADWRAALHVYAGLALLIAVPLMWLGSNRLESEHQHIRPVRPSHQLPEEKRYQFLRRPAFWLLACAFALLSLNHGVIINHLLPLLRDRNIAPEAAVLTASMIGPMQVFGRIVMMMVEKYLTVRGITLAVFASLTIGSVMLMGSAGWPLLLAPFVLFHGMGAGVQSIMKPMSTRELLGSENFGLKSGWISLPVLSGFAFAPYVGSLVWARGGYALVLDFVLACAVLGLVCYLATALDQNTGRGGGNKAD